MWPATPILAKKVAKPPLRPFFGGSSATPKAIFRGGSATLKGQNIIIIIFTLALAEPPSCEPPLHFFF